MCLMPSNFSQHLLFFTDLKEVGKSVFSMPVFTKEFSSGFLEELQNFKASGTPHERPNSMNRGGVLLDDLPFLDDFLRKFRTDYLQILMQFVFPEFAHVEFDSHKAFVVHYNADDPDVGDVDLAPHFDNAEATINVSISEGHEDGEIVFNEFSPHGEAVIHRFGCQHHYGHGLLHRGAHNHQALPVSSGQRWNLIIWLRSSQIRNRKCPMCGGAPRKIPVSDSDSSGDGFTMVNCDTSSAACSIS